MTGPVVPTTMAPTDRPTGLHVAHRAPSPRLHGHCCWVMAIWPACARRRRFAPRPNASVASACPLQSSRASRAGLTGLDEPSRAPYCRTSRNSGSTQRWDAGTGSHTILSRGCYEPQLTSPMGEGAMTAFAVRRTRRSVAHTMLVGLLALYAGQARAQHTASDTITRPVTRIRWRRAAH
jgi:hypothetical protein